MIEKKEVEVTLHLAGKTRAVYGVVGVVNDLGWSHVAVDDRGLTITPPLDDSDDGAYNAACEAAVAEYKKQ